MFDPALFSTALRGPRPDQQQQQPSSRKLFIDEAECADPTHSLTDMVAPRNLHFVPRRAVLRAPREVLACKPPDMNAPKKSIYELIDLAPFQQEEIIKLKREYYAVFDQIIFYYKVLPYYTWLAESLLLLVIESESAAAPAARPLPDDYYDAQLIDTCKAQLAVLMDYINGYELTEDDDSAIMIAGIRRKDIFSVGDRRAATNTIENECAGRRAQERWIPALDAMEYLATLRAPPTEEQARFRREQRALKRCVGAAPRGGGGENVHDYLIFLASLPLSAYDEMFRLRSELLTPSAEWRLHDLVTNLAPKKQPVRAAPSADLLLPSSYDGDLSAGEKNQFQLDDQSFTLPGMRRLLIFAQEELSRSKVAFDEVYTAAYQAIEFLEETGGKFSGMAAALVEAVQPYIDNNKEES